MTFGRFWLSHKSQDSVPCPFEGTESQAFGFLNWMPFAGKVAKDASPLSGVERAAPEKLKAPPHFGKGFHLTMLFNSEYLVGKKF